MQFQSIFLSIICFTGVIFAYEANRKCEENRADICKDLYNSTRFPNFFKQLSQSDAITELEQYKQLIQVQCARHLRLFLCSVIIPMCTMLEENILPCQSLCEDVKAGCEGILLNFVGISWPDRLRCNKFPKSGGDKVCIEYKKDSKEQTKKIWVEPDKKTKINENDKAILICKGKSKIRFKKIVHDKKNVCVRRVSQLAIRKRCDGEQTCDFTVADIAKEQRQEKLCKPGKIGPSSIKYQCIEDKAYKHMILNYGEDENLYCKSTNRRIRILKVQFRDEKDADTCITPNAFCSVTQSCTGKKSCALWADRSYLPSPPRPCKGLRPKLVVDYECEKISTAEKVVEDYMENITLQCPKDGVLTIIRAEYLSQFCRNKNIHCAVNLTCKKKHKCSLRESEVSAVKCTEERTKVRIRYLCT